MAKAVGFMPQVSEIPFPIPRQLRDDIERLIRAYEEDDPEYGDYVCEVIGSSRMVGREEDAWIRAHYVTGRGME